MKEDTEQCNCTGNGFVLQGEQMMQPVKVEINKTYTPLTQSRISIHNSQSARDRLAGTRNSRLRLTTFTDTVKSNKSAQTEATQIPQNVPRSDQTAYVQAPKQGNHLVRILSPKAETPLLEVDHALCNHKIKQHIYSLCPACEQEAVQETEELRKKKERPTE